MKLIILVAVALVALAVADPPEPAKILKFIYNPSNEGGYSYLVETEDGINRAETGEVKEFVDEEKNVHRVVVVRGTYSYPREDGVETIKYFADDTGFHAEGGSIPKAQ